MAMVAMAASATAAGCSGATSSGAPATTSTTAPSPTATADASPLPGVETFPGLGRTHVPGPVTYPQTPPVGGDHSPIWQNCGFYSEPIPSERGVHSLEHGAVWITYAPDLPPAQVDVLRALARRSYMLVSPFPGLPSPVVASAWGLQLRLPSADDPALAAFVARYRQGPQTPEPGASCTGGAGSPER